jgi:hypothetical protein
MPVMAMYEMEASSNGEDTLQASANDTRTKFLLENFRRDVQLVWLQNGGLGRDGVVVLVDQPPLVNFFGRE